MVASRSLKKTTWDRGPEDPPRSRHVRHGRSAGTKLRELEEREQVVRDELTDVLEVQRELEYIAHRYADLYEFAPLPCGMIDDKGRIEELNLGAIGLLGRSRGVLLGMPLTAFLAPEDRAGFLAHLRRHQGSGRATPFVAHLVTPARLRIPVELHLTRTLALGEEQPCFRLAIVDLREKRSTERDLERAREDLELKVIERTSALEASNRRLQEEIVRRSALERELREKAEALLELDQRKNEFIATLGHELRNPLAPLLHALASIEDASTNPEATRRAKSVIVRQVRHLAQLVNDLLEASRVTRGKVQLRPEPIALTEVAARAVELASPAVNARRHSCEVSIDPSLSVMGDPVRLAQVLSNLLDNAAKYTPEGGHITLTAEREGADAVLAVTDDGVGIPADLLGRLFQPFVQADRSLDRSSGGLGLGLALVRGLVELHGGTVTAESPGPGLGARFTIRLRALDPSTAASVAGGDARERPADACEPPADAEADDEHGAAGLKVLVVDDNIDAAESLAGILEARGAEVQTAFDGEAALERAHAFGPELVLLDIGLPKLDGYEVGRQLRTAEASPALLVALTGYGEAEARKRTAEAGFDFHIVKPLDPDRLDELVRSAISRRLLERAAVH